VTDTRTPVFTRHPISATPQFGVVLKPGDRLEATDDRHARPTEVRSGRTSRGWANLCSQSVPGNTPLSCLAAVCLSQRARGGPC
jgi:hypothetical protein